MKDDLGKRMKENYEQRTRTFLPRRTYTIIRLDGKAFHTLTRSCDKPFDRTLMTCMQMTADRLVDEIQGAVFSYTQSDEISILLQDFAKPTTDAWFDGNVQKIASISASMATHFFAQNQGMALDRIEHENDKNGTDDVPPEWLFRPALFDSRVFTIPDPIEVENYFIWRNQDCARNSINMVAQSKFSHKELQGKNTDECQEMLFQTYGINWSECAEDEKNGAISTREESFPFPAWKFTQERDRLRSLIPRYE